jgi:hemolysin D
VRASNSPRLDPARRAGNEPENLIKAFGSETGEIETENMPVKPRAIVYLLIVVLVALLAIAWFLDIDKVVVSQEGQVITTRPSIALQALDTSIIKSIDVEEGQIVKPGQLLETLDPTFTNADANALRIQIAGLKAQIARDESELAGRPLEYPPTGDPVDRKYEDLQTAYHLQRVQQYDSQVRSFDEQIALARATVAKLKADAAVLASRLTIAKQVSVMWDGLLARNSGTELQALTARDAVMQIDKDLQFDDNSIVETEHSIASTTANKEAFIQQWLGAASQDLVTSRGSEDAAIEQLSKAQRYSDLVRIEAPDDCIVLSIPKVSVGSVVKLGDPIMTLALLTTPVEAEIAVSPRDVGFVRVGDEVTVKLDAYEFVEHGTATGRLRWISEGTFTEDLLTGGTGATGAQSVNAAGAAQPYYKARISLTKFDFRDVPKDFRLLPGMTLSADVHVGRRHLLLYLLKGLLRVGFESMREPE